MRHPIERYRKLLRLAEIASKLVDREIARDQIDWTKPLGESVAWTRWRKLVKAVLATGPSA